MTVTKEPPLWVTGIDNGHDGVSFFRRRERGKVHVGERREASPVAFLSNVIMLCGVVGRQVETHDGWVCIGAFDDLDLCMSCHRAAGPLSDRLFEHPQDDDD